MPPNFICKLMCLAVFGSSYVLILLVISLLVVQFIRARGCLGHSPESKTDSSQWPAIHRTCVLWVIRHTCDNPSTSLSKLRAELNLQSIPHLLSRLRTVSFWPHERVIDILLSKICPGLF